jgi:hypothetical protein
METNSVHHNRNDAPQDYVLARIRKGGRLGRKGSYEMKELSKAARRKVDAACRRFQKQMEDILKKDTDIERITMQAGDGPDVTMAERKKRCAKPSLAGKDVTL